VNLVIALLPVSLFHGRAERQTSYSTCVPVLLSACRFCPRIGLLKRKRRSSNTSRYLRVHCDLSKATPRLGILQTKPVFMVVRYNYNTLDFLPITVSETSSVEWQLRGKSLTRFRDEAILSVRIFNLLLLTSSSQLYSRLSIVVLTKFAV